LLVATAGSTRASSYKYDLYFTDDLTAFQILMHESHQAHSTCESRTRTACGSREENVRTDMGIQSRVSALSSAESEREWQLARKRYCSWFLVLGSHVLRPVDTTITSFSPGSHTGRTSRQPLAQGIPKAVHGTQSRDTIHLNLRLLSTLLLTEVKVCVIISSTMTCSHRHNILQANPSD